MLREGGGGCRFLICERLGFACVYVCMCDLKSVRQSGGRIEWHMPMYLHPSRSDTRMLGIFVHPSYILPPSSSSSSSLSSYYPDKRA
ncbi:unnamed protein product [Anisakis simplex]|uniref:Secreted protein n=1 Tax=Anisakis simplex TaxID=6269 RepID=A0A0M3JHM5_ANISI|nr:unnamed protein product [Anisakis simplex]